MGYGSVGPPPDHCGCAAFFLLVLLPFPDPDRMRLGGHSQAERCGRRTPVGGGTMSAMRTTRAGSRVFPGERRTTPGAHLGLAGSSPFTRVLVWGSHAGTGRMGGVVGHGLARRSGFGRRRADRIRSAPCSASDRTAAPRVQAAWRVQVAHLPRVEAGASQWSHPRDAGRVCRGKEIDPRYVLTAIRRRETFTGETAGCA